ncbi:MAG: hypothetical protein ACREHD_19645, partial [Pirellulales bacterium]
SIPIVAGHLFAFGDVVRDRHVVATTAGPDLRPIVLSLGQMPDYRVEQAGGSFAKKKATQPNDFQIHYCVEDQWFGLDLECTNENIHAVQPLGADAWLLVRCRAADPTDRNAHVADSYGRIVNSFHAGDGIEDVQVTADSKIWCSFFDEGVYSHMEMGRSGLICLDAHGNTLFDYGRISGETSPIDDCYALNVSGSHETLLYYYSGFPLVQVTDFQLRRSWQRVPVSGSHAFSVAGQHALFFGSYTEKQTLFEVDLSTLRCKKLSIVSDDGEPINVSRAFGRAHHLYLVTDDSLFLIDLKA